MNNVYISEQVTEDLKSIFFALITWEKGSLSLEHGMQYVNDIENECYKTATVSKHFPTVYETHKKYGKNVHVYRRNANTTWYIVYNIDTFGNILINKIISNYTTIE